MISIDNIYFELEYNCMANILEQYTTSFPGSLIAVKVLQWEGKTKHDYTCLCCFLLSRWKIISLQSIKLKHYHVCLCFAKQSWSWSSTGRGFQCPSGTPPPKDLQSSPQGLWGPFCYTCHRLHVSAFWLGLFFNCLCSDWPNIITLGLINGWYVITILFLKKAFT